MSRFAGKTPEPKEASAPRPGLTYCNPAYGRTLAYVYLDANGDGEYEHLYNEDLITLGFARTTSFSHAYRREFERLRERAEERGTGLWAVCPEVSGY